MYLSDSHFGANISVLMVTLVCMVVVEIFFLWYCIIMLNANRYGWGTYLPVELAPWYCTWIGVENNGRWFYRCPMYMVFYILKPLLWMINNLYTLWNWGKCFACFIEQYHNNSLIWIIELTVISGHVHHIGHTYTWCKYIILNFS